MKAVGSNITKISKIQLYYGEILDALILTYETPSGPVTKSHGGTATGIIVTIDLSGKDSFLIMIYEYVTHPSVQSH